MSKPYVNAYERRFLNSVMFQHFDRSMTKEEYTVKRRLLRIVLAKASDVGNYTDQLSEAANQALPLWYLLQPLPAYRKYVALNKHSIQPVILNNLQLGKDVCEEHRRQYA